MAKFVITGNQKLAGEIEVLGAKNAALIIIAACCLMRGVTVLENVPNILDIEKIINILEKLGAKFTRADHQLTVDTTNLRSENPDSKLVGAIRASIVLAGPLLARFGTLEIPHPGGCTIGARPIDLHIQAFRKLGVEVQENNKKFKFLYNPKNLEIKTLEIEFPKISVTATENILLFSTIQANHIITIKNAAIEPEVIDLIEFLKKAGANISVNGRTIKITGQNNLKNVKHRVVPDRIEAGTFAIMAAASGSELKITNIIPDHIQSLLEKFQEMGVDFEKGNDFLYIKNSNNLKSIDISTSEYPGFPTDLQPPMGILLTQSTGKSQISENIFENRLGYLSELKKMGANIDIKNLHKAEITGPSSLTGAKIESLDLRAGATLLIAGLIAQGTTEIKHAENIDRGYEKIETRLEKIGAKIKRIE